MKDIFTPLSKDEYEQFKPITQKQIREALEKGSQDWLKAKQRGIRHVNKSRI
jgi:hypothetical protein